MHYKRSQSLTQNGYVRTYVLAYNVRMCVRTCVRTADAVSAAMPVKVAT